MKKKELTVEEAIKKMFKKTDKKKVKSEKPTVNPHPSKFPKN